MTTAKELSDQYNDIVTKALEVASKWDFVKSKKGKSYVADSVRYEQLESLNEENFVCTRESTGNGRGRGKCSAASASPTTSVSIPSTGNGRGRGTQPFG